MILFSDNTETQEVTPATPVVAAEELEQIELEAAVEPATDAPTPRPMPIRTTASTSRIQRGSTCARSRAFLCSPQRKRSSWPRGSSSALRIRDRAVDGHPRSPRVDAPRDGGDDARQAIPCTPCHLARGSQDRAQRASPTTRAGDLLVTAPRFGFTEAAAEAQGGPASELLERARNLRAVYNERLDAETFMTLLDWVHDGRLAARRSATSERCVAMQTWARDEVAIPAIRRWIEAGKDAEILAELGYRPTDEASPRASSSRSARRPAIT